MQPLQKSRLGRGLASLIGDIQPTSSEPRLPPEGEQRILAIDLIRPGKLNPRKDFREDDLVELSESIRQKGIVHCADPPKSALVARRVLRSEIGTAALSQLRVLLQKALWVTFRSGVPERSVT